MARWLFLIWILGVALTVGLIVVRRRTPPLMRRRWGPIEKAIAALIGALVISALLAGTPLGIIEFLKRQDAPQSMRRGGLRGDAVSPARCGAIGSRCAQGAAWVQGAG